MKLLIATLLLTPLLAGCNPDTQENVDQKYTVSVQTRIKTSEMENIFSRDESLKQAKSRLEVAKYDTQVSVIEARAKAEANKLIEDSVRDKSLLKKYDLGTDGGTWSRTQTGITTTFQSGYGYATSNGYANSTRCVQDSNGNLICN